jgi:phosphopantothenoylcysteine decarboxylase/phosphopantothenate--cysteine ligase
MGVALTQACLELRHQVVVVSGPVEVEYPPAAEVVSVVSTDEMLAACCRIFPDCDGVIGAAAPCDYRPVRVENNKIAKTGEPLQLHLVETSDVVATLGAQKKHQWLVGFALETEDHRFRAIVKLERKSCDLIVLNEPTAMNSDENRVEVLAPEGKVGETISGSKRLVAQGILKVIQKRLVECDRS